MSRKSWNEKSCLAAGCGVGATATFAAARVGGVSVNELPVVNMAGATQAPGQRKSAGFRGRARRTRQQLPLCCHGPRMRATQLGSARSSQVRSKSFFDRKRCHLGGPHSRAMTPRVGGCLHKCPAFSAFVRRYASLCAFCGKLCRTRLATFTPAASSAATLSGIVGHQAHAAVAQQFEHSRRDAVEPLVGGEAPAAHWPRSCRSPGPAGR